jgi:hypothetical protein
MPALSHIGLGLAAKRAEPRISVVILVLAPLALDILWGVFAAAQAVRIIPEGADTLPWSHGIFMSVLWSVLAALLAALVYRSVRACATVGLLVFSHWVLDYLMWPPTSGLLYAGGTEIGLNFGRSRIVAVVFEFGVLILGIVIYLRTRTAGLRTQNNP